MMGNIQIATEKSRKLLNEKVKLNKRSPERVKNIKEIRDIVLNLNSRIIHLDCFPDFVSDSDKEILSNISEVQIMSILDHYFKIPSPMRNNKIGNSERTVQEMTIEHINFFSEKVDEILNKFFEEACKNIMVRDQEINDTKRIIEINRKFKEEKE